MVLIEHDIPLVMQVSDRVQCLVAGRTLAVGEPEDVRSDPAVVAAYLGTDERVIARSGAVAAVGGEPVPRRAVRRSSVDLSDLSRAELLALARRHELRDRSRMTVPELRAALQPTAAP